MLCLALLCLTLALRLVLGKKQADVEWDRDLSFFQVVLISGFLRLLRNSRKDLALAPRPRGPLQLLSPPQTGPGFTVAAAKYKIVLLVNPLLPGSLMSEALQCPAWASCHWTGPHRDTPGVPWKAGGSRSVGGHLRPLPQGLENRTHLGGLEGGKGLRLCRGGRLGTARERGEIGGHRDKEPGDPVRLLLAA